MNTEKKTYKNVDELMKILSDRGMIFSQPIRAKRLIIQNNYYSITAFKHLFYKPGTREYITNVDFENLFSVYVFDKKLKIALLRQLLFIEQKIKSAMSIVLSEKYGIRQTKYLKKENFDLTNPNVEATLSKVKKQIRTFGTKNPCVSHYKRKHGFVPFWILSKCLTMGVIRDLFNIMKPDDQNKVADIVLERKIDKKPVRALKTMIALIADIRNMCAHDEVLLNYKHSRLTIPPLYEHSFLNLRKQSNGEYIQGRKDLLALLITIRYLVNRSIYKNLINHVSNMSKKTYEGIKHLVRREDFLDYIGLCADYEKLKYFDATDK